MPNLAFHLDRPPSDVAAFVLEQETNTYSCSWRDGQDALLLHVKNPRVVSTNVIEVEGCQVMNGWAQQPWCVLRFTLSPVHDRRTYLQIECIDRLWDHLLALVARMSRLWPEVGEQVVLPQIHEELPEQGQQVPALNDIERDIVDLFSKKMGVRQIADKKSLSEGRVRNIMAELRKRPDGLTLLPYRQKWRKSRDIA